MSLNGDLTVVRNGRSTSEVSVYNYPEHLNPFYEDDNHSRLRFWKIGKGLKGGTGRRNSFSLSGLKDIWTFKSFRMNKKSSSLGINKTSESPPPLRRDLFIHENGYGTYDPRMRHTTGPANNLTVGDAFERNASYRSSLQDMRSPQGANSKGFNRNDRYRSTIQTSTSNGTGPISSNNSLAPPTPRRYVYRGSVTPQPVRSNDFNRDSLGMISRGSSQASVSSTNPFEDDDEDDVVMRGVTATSTPTKYPARKKKRAPPPPVPVPQIITEENSSAGSTPSHKSDSQQENSLQNESLEIHNLTAEIEDFVRSSNSDSAEGTTSPPTKVTKITINSSRNGTIPKDRQNSVTTHVTTKTEVITLQNKDDTPLFIREENEIDITKPKDNHDQNPVKEVGQMEVIQLHIENPRQTPGKESNTMSTFRSETKESQISPTKVTKLPRVEGHITQEDDKIGQAPQKPPVAAKPNIKKPLTPKMLGARRENVPPDTPTMRRRNINVETSLSSSPELNSDEDSISKERVIVGALGTTIKGEQVTSKLRKSPISDENINISSSSRDEVKTVVTNTIELSSPPPTTDTASRKEENLERPSKHDTTDGKEVTPSTINEITINEITAAEGAVALECNASLLQMHEPASSPDLQADNKTDVPIMPKPSARKISNINSIIDSQKPNNRDFSTTDNEINLSSNQGPKAVQVVKSIEIEEKISNLDVQLVPTTISELQRNISENEEIITQKPSTSPRAQETTICTPSPTPRASTSKGDEPRPAPIQKPPRAKHPPSDEPSDLYRAGPSYWKQSTLAPLEPVPPEKRRSVKEIIESINRSQRLLNGKKENEYQTDCTNTQRRLSDSSTNEAEQNLKSLAEAQREMKRMLVELDGLENANEQKLSNRSNENFQGILDTIEATLARETQKDNNTAVFKKCVIKKEINNSSRESSPTSSNLDWNPVPKPKRTKNLSPELQVKNNNNKPNNN